MPVIGPDPTGTIVNGSSDSDVIDSGGGNDAVHAYEGDDTVYGGANRDHLYGEDGNDFLDGEGENDKLYGGAGDDTLVGGGQNDRLYGGDGDDIINGGDDDDVLFGDNPSDGNDNEGGHDIFLFDGDDGNDKVFDFEHGIDKVHLLGDDLSYTLDYTNSGNTVMTWGATTVTFYDEKLDASDILVV
ncbi:calcium-binding protein [Novosphingobium beihaiensis]|uniref:Calcium-binding protein n=1 Tax=Novosphingobium beihaiensis TaxID=2930389 RepID=A0ABT0BVE3_9SPHN|nr:calcium-binding protein [Novosphingobium beihaiensis]MCJ2188609.1 calcium-binding protein [Novosphingobium beihaiensis]